MKGTQVVRQSPFLRSLHTVTMEVNTLWISLSREHSYNTSRNEPSKETMALCQTTPVALSYEIASGLLGPEGRSFNPKPIWKQHGWEHLPKPADVPFSELTLAKNGTARILSPCSGQPLSEIIKALAKSGVKVKLNVASQNQHFALSQRSSPMGWLAVPIAFLDPELVGCTRKGSFIHTSLKLADAIHMLGMHMMQNLTIAPENDCPFWFETVSGPGAVGPDGFFVTCDYFTKEITISPTFQGKAEPKRGRTLPVIALERK